MRERMPRFIHLPIQILWFDTPEIFSIVIGYLVGLIFGGLAWFAVLIIPALFIPYKRSKSRGFLGHFLHEVGFAELKGYPISTANKFKE